MDPLAYDLYIQDFIKTNILLNQHVSWDTLVSRRFVEDGKRKIFKFKRGESTEHVVGELVVLPDAEWFCLTMTGLPAVSELQTESVRFDCLRMTSQNTHYTLDISQQENILFVRLMTKHRGLSNIAFVIRNQILASNPMLL